MPYACIDLIYLDPPFNSKRAYYNPIAIPPEYAEGLYRDYTSMGENVIQAGFDDNWTMDLMVRNESGALTPNPNWKPLWMGLIADKWPALHSVLRSAGQAQDSQLQGYLTFMAVRLVEMRRILKATGAIYLHCDPTAGHYLKTVMDCIFGKDNFIDEIIWNYGTPSGGRAAGKKPVKSHETLLAYAVSYGKHTYNRQYLPYSNDYVTRWFRHTDEDGRKYRTRSRKGQIVRQYLDESPGVPLSNTWSDIRQLYGSSGWFPGNRKEITNYPTQKPLALLDRIILMASNPGDIVLDPFCGCATACVSAEKLGRRWIGIDRGEEAYNQVIQRLASTLRLGSEEIPLLLAPEDHVTRLAELPGQSYDVRVAQPITESRQRRISAGRPQVDDNVKRLLYGFQEGDCIGCAESISYRNAHVDHVIPDSRDGPTEQWNLQLLCGFCNSRKGNRLTTRNLWEINEIEGVLPNRARVERLWKMRESERVNRQMEF